eukprot:2633434-Pleurochrysis_carterae.AAC.1
MNPTLLLPDTLVPAPLPVCCHGTRSVSTFQSQPYPSPSSDLLRPLLLIFVQSQPFVASSPLVAPPPNCDIARPSAPRHVLISAAATPFPLQSARTLSACEHAER